MGVAASNPLLHRNPDGTVVSIGSVAKYVDILRRFSDEAKAMGGVLPEDFGQRVACLLQVGDAMHNSERLLPQLHRKLAECLQQVISCQFKGTSQSSESCATISGEVRCESCWCAAAAAARFGG